MIHVLLKDSTKRATGSSTSYFGTYAKSDSSKAVRSSIGRCIVGQQQRCKSCVAAAWPCIAACSEVRIAAITSFSRTIVAALVVGSRRDASIRGGLLMWQRSHGLSLIPI